ncbi:ubiquinone/menaquinone biosynthesis C-methylase UbiE [Nakamurella sp. UYEF19]|uniref:class I SAM-dependent methyltransferase n=1 Tax=Nakamurella sp. UYEF19 TaxID=1756392 RepID=UPI003397452B
MTENPAGAAGIFNRVADTYDAVGVEWFGPIARGLISRLDPQPGEVALDIGCGRGAALLPLATAVGPAGRALGFDLAPRMVAATAADLSGLPQAEVRIADAQDPGLDAATFDVIASSLVLFFLSDPAAAMKKWADLLATGGRLGIATFAGRDPRWIELDQLFTPFLPPGMKDARTSGQAGPFASDQGVAALFTDAGLTQVRTESATVKAVLADPEHWLRFSRSHGQRAMWEAVPVEQHPDIESAASEMLEGFREPDGSIVFWQDVRYTFGRRA